MRANTKGGGSKLGKVRKNKADLLQTAGTPEGKKY